MPSPDWIDSINSAWTGHRPFAEWLVKKMQPEVVVDLGVDYGYSSFVFSDAIKTMGQSGHVYGVDSFIGNPNIDLHEYVKQRVAEHNVDNFTLIYSDFAEAAKTWDRPIDILHIDGFHEYENVSSDYSAWHNFVNKSNGVILFHDIESFEGVKRFFFELDVGTEWHKAYFTHCYGLGVLVRDKELYESIFADFGNCFRGN